MAYVGGCRGVEDGKMRVDVYVCVGGGIAHNHLSQH